jgi:hypothetical protein
MSSITFEVAGLGCRIECDYPKPILWVTELHPAFRCDRDADLVVSFRYDDGYWARGFPWVAPDRLIDAPVYEAGPDGVARLRTAYYDAEIDASRERVETRIAGGFGVGGMLRALYAALLPARGACLVRATVRPEGHGAVLVCGDPSDTEGVDGVVALVSDGAHVTVEPTPFHGGTSASRAPRLRVLTVETGVAATSRAAAAAAVLAHVVVVDHSASTLERALDVVTRLPTPIPEARVAGVTT